MKTIRIEFRAIDFYGVEVCVPNEVDPGDYRALLRLIADRDLDTAANLDIANGGTFIDKCEEVPNGEKATAG